MTTIRQGFLIVCTAALWPALPAAADEPIWPAAEMAMPAAPSEPEVPAVSWDPLHFALAAELHSVWIVQDDARRLWGKDRLTSGGLSVSWDALQVGRKMTLGLDLAWIWTKVSAATDATPAQEISTQVFDLGLSLRYEILHWLAPYVRVGGGMGWADLSLSQSGFELRDRARLYQGSAGAGVFFRSPGLSLGRTKRSPRLAFVGRMEGGYTVGNATEFSLTLQAEGASKNPIPVAPVSSGEVRRRFPYLRVSVGVAF
jgi:hypothetical protein